MHRNEIFYALIGINNQVSSCLISMLSVDPCFGHSLVIYRLCECELFTKNPYIYVYIY